MGLRITEPDTVELITEWTAEIDLIVSALDAGRDMKIDRRSSQRHRQNTIARLKFHSDPADAQPTLLFIRDADANAIGFITQHNLPLGYRGIVTFENESGDVVTLGGTLLRCRPCAPDWYEGAFRFGRR
jgi:hypothetical protein